jgi:hypothetical protein
MAGCCNISLRAAAATASSIVGSIRSAVAAATCTAGQPGRQNFWLPQQQKQQQQLQLQLLQ